MMNTIKVPMPVSLRLDQVTLDTSCRTWRTNWAGETLAMSNRSNVPGRNPARPSR